MASKKKSYNVSLTLDEAKAFRAAVLGDHFDTLVVDSAIKKVNAAEAKKRADSPEEDDDE